MKIMNLLLALALTSLLNAQPVVLVLNKNENSLSFLNGQTLATIKKIPTGEGPHEVAISADGKTAVVANYGHQQPGNSLSVIDVLEQKEIKRVDLGALLRPHGLVFLHNKVYFTAEASRVVGSYDVISGKVDWLQGTGQSLSHMLAVLSDGKRLYTANILSNTVTAINIGAPPGPEHIKHIAVGPKPEAIEATPDGKEVWVGQNDDGNISIIRTADNTVTHTIKAGEMPIRIKFTPDGKKALVADPKGKQLLLFDAVTKELIKKLAVEGSPVGTIISRDGKTAYVAMTNLDTVALINLDDLSITKQGSTGKNPDGIGLAY